MKSNNSRSFTLIEVLITFAIFAVVLGVVAVTTVQLFKSFHQGEKMMDTRQKERLFLFGLSREISSVARITYPQNRFKGDENSFFLSMPGRTAW